MLASRIGEGAPGLQRKIKFTDPTPTRENPIKRVLSEPTLGYTLPTVNGKALPNGFDAAGSLLFDALQPQQSSYDPATKECRFADFDVTISANVTVITQPANEACRSRGTHAAIALSGDMRQTAMPAPIIARARVSPAVPSAYANRSAPSAPTASSAGSTRRGP